MRRIWIVDDEANIGLSLRLILEREGFAVTAFTSASDYRRAPGREQVALFLTASAAKKLLENNKVVHNVANDVTHDVVVRTIALDNLHSMNAVKEQVVF